MEDLITFFKQTQKEFCSLFNFKIHGDTIEFITPFATMSDKFVSVFVTQRNSKIIASDGGFISKNIYEYERSINTEKKEVIQALTNQFISIHEIRQTNINGIIYYYKDTNQPNLLPAIVFDVVNFIVAMVNAHSVEYKDKKEKEERDKFKAETNEFLKDTYKDAFIPNKQIVQGLSINGVIQNGNDSHLLEYVTGHTARYFGQDMKKAIINFQLVEKIVTLKPYIKNRIAIFNDLSAGYQLGVPPLLSNHLRECTTREYLLRTDLEDIVQIISLN